MLQGWASGDGGGFAIPKALVPAHGVSARAVRRTEGCKNVSILDVSPRGEKMEM